MHRSAAAGLTDDRDHSGAVVQVQLVASIGYGRTQGPRIRQRLAEPVAVAALIPRFLRTLSAALG
jgi:hypothetical protein